jgi:hypothetical protein
MTEPLDHVFTSVLPNLTPANTITLTTLDTGELDITLTSQNETWGERLNAKDTRQLARALTRPDTPQENKP